MSGSRRELFGFYRPGATWVHRARLGPKAAGLLVLSILLMLPIERLPGVAAAEEVMGLPARAAAWAVPALCLALVIGIGTSAGIRPRGWWHSIRPTIWILALLIVYHAITGRPAMAAEVVLTVLAALLATRVLLETTPLPALLDGLVRLLGPLRLIGVDPQRVGLAIQIMLRSIPFLMGALEGIREAASARGIRMGPVGLATPVVIAAVAHGQRTGEALAARGLD